jgi:hypothetical protein
MSQTSYEVMRRAIEFEGPDRLPVMFNTMGVNDAHGVGWNQIGTGDNSLSETVDEWGCTWQRSEVSNMGQVKGHPLESWTALEGFRWPDPDNPAFYEGMEARFEGAEDRYVFTSIFMLLFERMHALRGFENVLMDIALGDERIEMLADRIVEFDIAIIENISRRFPGRIHGFTCSDDWGTELATFVSPPMWEVFFRPRYQRIFDAVHAQGWHMWMHSCGKVNEYLPIWADMGLDVVNLQQPRALGIEEVGEEMAGRICFQSLCDIQHTLPFKDAAAIREEAALLLESWGTPEGGFILADYGDGAAIGVSDDKKRIMFEAFMEFDPWKR